jgi:NAD(P)H-nitrite reductase large subunit
MHIVIIGNGISGITAARHIRKMSDHRITVISSESEYFFSRTALMYVYMGHMKFEHTKPYEDWFWKKNRIELVKDLVDSIDIDSSTLLLNSGARMSFEKLIISTGSISNKPDYPGKKVTGVQGLYSKQDLENMELQTKNIERAVIVGGGLIGIEMAEMLHSRNIPVTFLVREENFWDPVLPEQEARLIGNHIIEHGIDLRLKTSLQQIIPDKSGRVKAVITDKGESIDCGFVGLTVGVSPNIEFLLNSGIEYKRGVIVNEFLETNIPAIYAIGDCAEFINPLPGRKPVEQVWYTGRIMGETVAKTICGKRSPYSPGIWFNSAKFFDIEYLTYGGVSPLLKEDEETFYWELPNRRILLRLNYKNLSHTLIGVNSFGIRLRHECFARWLEEKKTVEFVLEHLHEANFDPEFFQQYEEQILRKFNDEKGTKLRCLGRRGLLHRVFAS